MTDEPTPLADVLPEVLALLAEVSKREDGVGNPRMAAQAQALLSKLYPPSPFLSDYAFGEGLRTGLPMSVWTTDRDARKDLLRTVWDAYHEAAIILHGDTCGCDHVATCEHLADMRRLEVPVGEALAT